MLPSWSLIREPYVIYHATGLSTDPTANRLLLRGDVLSFSFVPNSFLYLKWDTSASPKRLADVRVLLQPGRAYNTHRVSFSYTGVRREHICIGHDAARHESAQFTIARPPIVAGKWREKPVVRSVSEGCALQNGVPLDDSVPLALKRQVKVSRGLS